MTVEQYERAIIHGQALGESEERRHSFWRDGNRKHGFGCTVSAKVLGSAVADLTGRGTGLDDGTGEEA